MRASALTLVLVAVFALVLIVIGNYGWEIILGFISLIILAGAYLVIRIIMEYPTK